MKDFKDLILIFYIAFMSILLCFFISEKLRSVEHKIDTLIKKIEQETMEIIQQ